MEQYLKSSVSKDPVVSVIFPGEEGEKEGVEMRKMFVQEALWGEI